MQKGMMLMVASFTLFGCAPMTSYQSKSLEPLLMAAKACEEKSLSAFAETKLAYLQAVFYETKSAEDRAATLCRQNRVLFQSDCTLECTQDAVSRVAEVSGDSSICTKPGRQKVKLTEMWDVCELFK